MHMYAYHLCTDKFRDVKRITLILEEISTHVDNCLCKKTLPLIPFYFFLHYHRMTATVR